MLQRRKPCYGQNRIALRQKHRLVRSGCLAGHPFCAVRFNEHDICKGHPALQLCLRRGRQFAAGCSGSGHGITAALPQAEKLCIRLCPDPAGRLHNMGGGSGQYPPALAGAVRSQIVHQCGLSAAAHQRNNMSLLRKKRKNFFVDHFCFSATAMAIFSGVMGSS